MLSRRDVELPAMPGTCDDTSLKGSFAKRPPCVRANPVDDVKRSVNVVDSQYTITDRHFLARSRRNVTDIRDA